MCAILIASMLTHEINTCNIISIDFRDAMFFMKKKAIRITNLSLQVPKRDVCLEAPCGPGEALNGQRLLVSSDFCGFFTATARAFSRFVSRALINKGLKKD
jgi:hypothetical protein